MTVGGTICSRVRVVWNERSSAGRKTERWTSGDLGLLQQNQMDSHGITMNALAYLTPYIYTIKTGSFSIKPYIGGGFVYRRFKIDRQGITGGKILLPGGDCKYYFSNQSILAIGAMPHIGFYIMDPKDEIEFRLGFGCAFLSANSNFDIIRFPFSSLEEGNLYPLKTDTSGHSYLVNLDFIKKWNSFSIGLGYEWEKIYIDDKSILYNKGKRTGGRLYVAYIKRKGGHVPNAKNKKDKILRLLCLH